MINIETKVLGVLKVQKATTQRAATIDAEMFALVSIHGQLLNTQIKANASGRPGPNAPTGDYRRSWAHTVTREGPTTVSTNGTNKPQARRLEFGFTGIDSLGRVYDQPPYPHVGPAFDEIEPKFVNAAEKLMRSV
jgi:hypothetical protein